MSTSESLGATLGPDGVTFRLRAPHATGVEVCLFEDSGEAETDRVALERDDGGLWFAQVDALTAGRLYGYRVDGPYRPSEGHRFNPVDYLQKILPLFR